MSDRSTTYESDAQAIERDPRATPREAATRQALPPTAGDRLQRRRRTADPLFIDPRIVPKGFSYEWKLSDTFGQPAGAHQGNLRENHWKAVPASRHPPLAIGEDTVIRRPGTILMERPLYLTEDAQMEDLQEALKPVQHMEEVMYGSKPGELTRDHPSVRRVSRVNQQWSPGEPINEGQGGLSAEP